jgi:transposase-like protein
MKNIAEFETLAEFLEYFKDEETCRNYFAAMRFRNGEYCPHCGHKEIYTFSNGRRYRCAKCKEDFTIKTGTVFGESKVPLRKWFIAIYLLSTTSKGISSVQLAKHVGVTQKTGWFMDHRLRKAMRQNKDQLFGTIEIDESYIGGKTHNMHKKEREKSEMGAGGKGKAIVLGMRSREFKEVRTKVVKNNSYAELHPPIVAAVKQGSTLHTDEHSAYEGMLDYKRSTVKHRSGIYVDGETHTNGIESFWALFKRGYHGVYHQMSRKHLQKYVDECAYRLNRKAKGSASMFASVVERVTETDQLPYKELIA